MIGFKQVSELTIDECFEILVNDSSGQACNGVVETRFKELLPSIMLIVQTAKTLRLIRL